MSDGYRLREACESDAGVIADYNLRLAWETEHRRLKPEVVRRGVEALLKDRAKGEYFVAEAAKAPDWASTPHRAVGVIGQCCVTYEWSDWRNGDIWWFQSVYIEATWRAQGVFRALFDHVHRAALAKGVVGLRLYVDGKLADERSNVNTLLRDSDPGIKRFRVGLIPAPTQGSAEMWFDDWSIATTRIGCL